MSDQEFDAQPAPGADHQSPQLTSGIPKRRRDADTTIREQDPVREYLKLKQARGLMTDSEKRLLDKIAAVCGMYLEVSETAFRKNPPAGKS